MRRLVTLSPGPCVYRTITPTALFWANWVVHAHMGKTETGKRWEDSGIRTFSSSVQGRSGRFDISRGPWKQHWRASLLGKQFNKRAQSESCASEPSRRTDIERRVTRLRPVQEYNKPNKRPSRGREPKWNNEEQIKHKTAKSKRYHRASQTEQCVYTSV